jgi:hypothetical protein
METYDMLIKDRTLDQLFNKKNKKRLIDWSKALVMIIEITYECLYIYNTHGASKESLGLNPDGIQM